MARFKKAGSRKVPGINTGSMSDIIFMFLFFFMVITTIREVTLLVRIKPPQASEVQKLEKKALVSYIYVGSPVREYQAKFGTDSKIQLDDKFATMADIRTYIASEW